MKKQKKKRKNSSRIFRSFFEGTFTKRIERKIRQGRKENEDR